MSTSATSLNFDRLRRFVSPILFLCGLYFFFLVARHFIYSETHGGRSTYAYSSAAFNSLRWLVAIGIGLFFISKRPLLKISGVVFFLTGCFLIGGLIYAFWND